MIEPTTFLDGKVELYAGDNLPILRQFPDNHFDLINCDPPYGIAFMGRADWDGAGPDQRAFQRLFWRECRRVLKPGGHVMAFGAARTYHRLATAIEDGGFEIRDTLWQLVEADAGVKTFLASLDASQAEAFRRLCEGSDFGGILGWVFGTGWPKGRELSKAIDAHLGIEGTLGAPKSAAHAEWIARGSMRGEGGHDGYQRPWMDDPDAVEANAREYVGGCEASREWAGFYPALKPALEPICLARKPFEGKLSLAANVLKWACGALNINPCRIEGEDDRPLVLSRRDAELDLSRTVFGGGLSGSHGAGTTGIGRYPSHLILDGSDQVLAAFPSEAGAKAPVRGTEPSAAATGEITGLRTRVAGAYHADAGSASRFFYSGKADDVDRIGLEHPTIKPVDPIEYLCRLGGRPGALVLDPFAGSGTTGEAAFRAGMRAVLIERDPKHCAMIAKRMAYAVSTDDARRSVARRAKAARREAAGKSSPTNPALDLFA